jgi:hypothetical protein
MGDRNISMREWDGGADGRANITDGMLPYPKVVMTTLNLDVKGKKKAKL